jgi:hypothetical protein
MELERIAKALVFSSFFAKYCIKDALPAKPRNGDFVYEWTSIRTPPYLDKVGILVEMNTIETLDGRIIHWENASFRRIPESFAYQNELLDLEDPNDISRA